MLVIKNPHHTNHNPHWKFVLGQDVYETRDIPERAIVIENKLKEDKEFKFINAKSFPEYLISNIHPYFRFIKQTSKAIKDDKTENYPDLFPGEGANLPRKIDPLWGGLYCTDCVTPIMKGTYQAARGSAEAALTGAKILLENDKKEVYALCRPSGHHAGPRIFGGYCYFNNAVLAANLLLEKGNVALLDIDYHHGNGTQEFFSNNDKVFTSSIHADPELEYPYFWGYEKEIYEGPAILANYNAPLPINTTDDIYLEALEKVLYKIKNFNPDFLVISAGFDTHKEDNIGFFNLSTDVYAHIGEKIANLQLPTLICQEGGYNLNVLGDSVYNFLKGFSHLR